MNLLQKLLEIQKNCHGLGKDSKTYSYQYVSGSKVLGVIRPLMDRHGILLKTEITDVTNVRYDYMVANKIGGERQKSEIHTTAKLKFTWVDVESGEREECYFFANGQNDWDKGVGSALTYAERYFLLKFFHISTDEDDCDFLTAQRQEEERKAEEARKKAEAEAKKKAEEAKKPKPITEVQLTKVVERLKAGENILEATLKSFVLTPEQKTILDEIVAGGKKETSAPAATKEPAKNKEVKKPSIPQKEFENTIERIKAGEDLLKQTIEKYTLTRNELDYLTSVSNKQKSE